MRSSSLCSRYCLLVCPVVLCALTALPALAQPPSKKLYLEKLNVEMPHISTDKSVKYDYDIVYVRAPLVVKNKDGKEQQAPVWPDDIAAVSVTAGCRDRIRSSSWPV